MKRFTPKSLAFLLTSIILAVIGIGLIVLLIVRYGPRRPQTNISEDTLERFQSTQEIVVTPTPFSSPTPITPSQTVQSSPTAIPTASPTPSPTPTPEWMTYDGIDFKDQEIETLLTTECEGEQIYLNPFYVTPYSPNIIESGAFFFNLDFSIAWEHLGFYGLWVHSGVSNEFGELPAYPLQLYLENNAQGFRRNPEEMLAHIQNCLIGSELRLRQGENLSVSKVVAAVRVPPSDVDEVSSHPMTMVPYLAEKYPESGFDQMELPGLLYYFCGRNLSGEAFNTSFSYWTQSRFIIGFMPVDGD